MKPPGFKLVISTISTPTYHRALKNLLNSLDLSKHIDEIFVVVSGVPLEEHRSMQLQYQQTFGLKTTNVLTYPFNSFEYGSFVAVAECLELIQENKFFAFIHDTTQAGPAFWKHIYDILEAVDPPTIEISGDIYSLSKPLRIADTLISRFKMSSDGYLVSTDYQSVYLSSGWSLVLEKDDAIAFNENTASYVETKLDKDKLIWFPFADNFNMGIATREFLTQYMRPNFTNKELTKAEAIEIELSLDHPLNFKNLAKGKWQYATRVFGRILSPEPWKNKHDIYGDGVLRCICGLFDPDLIKFVRLAE